MLWATFILMNLTTFGLFKNLPNLGGLLVDLQFSYSHEQLILILTEIGEKGRATYLWANLVDMVFPVFYSSFFAGFLYRFRIREGLWLLALIPILLAFVDWGENIQIRAMLQAFPDISEEQTRTASLFTSIKQVLVNITLGLFMLVGILVLIGKYRDNGR